MTPEEQAFTEAYRKTNYPRPAVTSDVVLFKKGKSQILLIKRGGHPFKGHWALPGGFLEVGDAFENQGEELIEGALRELEEETGITGVELIQLGAFGKPYRDSRTRTITIAWIGFTDQDPIAGDDASDVGWFSINELPNLAFDHDEIILAAKAKLKDEILLKRLDPKLIPNI